MDAARSIILCFVLTLFYFGSAQGREYQMSCDILGTPNWYRIKPGDSLIEIARTFDLGFNEITDANPQIDPFIPRAGAEIELPLAWILPRAAHRGIVINLAEMRLYFFPDAGGKVATFPVGIGEAGAETPLGTFTVTEKVIDPVWHVPESIRRENPDVAEEVAAGPENPLGTRALRISAPGILIHGTNRPWGQGRRISHGCIRLYPEDIIRIFEAVPVGTKVTIVNEPVKIGVRNNRIYVEAHRRQGADYLTEALTLLKQEGHMEQVDLMKLKAALFRKRGVPADISK